MSSVFLSAGTSGAVTGDVVARRLFLGGVSGDDDEATLLREPF